MRILVTGSSGFFGSWLIPGLEAAGHEIVGYDLKNGQDIQDAGALAEAMKGCQAVIHLAAYPHYMPPGTGAEPAPRPHSPQEFTRRNIIGTARVIEAMKRAKVGRLVYTSSGALYGFGPGRPLEGWVKPPISEDQYPVGGDWAMIDAYGASKIASEEWLKLVPTMTITALRINCIEPHHWGAKDGAHWGWYCLQATATRAYLAALERTKRGFVAVNVGEPSKNMDQSRLMKLWDGTL